MIAGSDDPVAPFRRWFEGSSPPGDALRHHVQATLEDIERLREDCAEAYQVVGELASLAGQFGHPTTTKALDNLDAAAAGQPRLHTDVLPTAFEGRSTAGETMPSGSGA